ncbi:hypothetical protein I6N98_15035 [Spongiibacter nanhainus]|uniref:Uncharacterized protein n=1 Tax=Spongiibacter nanhainus TaxID=2794344 RepID=A0A7T4UQ22_9GAMM|nr:hypothetical protein [Spongiibacter nanhainus]QQD17648.1 hypothetical protein I6N98_15035 [Spongiibacter nanhainus]
MIGAAENALFARNLLEFAQFLPLASFSKSSELLAMVNWNPEFSWLVLNTGRQAATTVRRSAVQ